MYDAFIQLMGSVPTDNPVVYICYWLTVMSMTGVFFRFLYTLFKPY